MSPTYETEADRTNESRIAQRLRAGGSDVKQLKRYYPCDFLVTNPSGQVSLIEYKRRHHIFGKYQQVMLPALKVSNCKNLANLLRCKFHLLFEYNDGLYTTEVADSYDVGVGGRNDRGKDEYEPMVLIDHTMFKKIGDS